jgi:hypothetical protein
MLVLTKKLNCFLSFSISVFFEPETLTVLIIKKPSFSKGSSEDAENLIKNIQNEVFKKTNINLELELEVVGTK